ncbi:MAG TPA: glycosyltransferase family 2 protein [Gaiellaceae bacterium]|nr:glycosyltransferase family 2 protein [Gaiellaceae bacterium]
MAETLVFLPAWNEERNLAPVLEELRRELPDADVLVVDDGSSDATARVAREHGADVVSFGKNRGLRAAIAAGYATAAERGYAWCGRVDADGQHPAAELRRLLERVRGGDCDVAVGSRFVAGDGYEEYRYRPSADRALGTAVLRRLMELRLDRPFGDATSGMYAANAHAAALLAQPYASDAPEVEGLIRLAEAGLRVEEVPVDMRERQGGESKLAGKKALKVVLTVGATILLGRHVLRALRR